MNQKVHEVVTHLDQEFGEGVWAYEPEAQKDPVLIKFHKWLKEHKSISYREDNSAKPFRSMSGKEIDSYIKNHFFTKGETIRKIAADLGYDRADTVSKHVRKIAVANGIDFETHKTDQSYLAQIDKQQLLEKVENLETISEIAKDFCIKDHNVNYLLRKFDLMRKYHDLYYRRVGVIAIDQENKMHHYKTQHQASKSIGKRTDIIKYSIDNNVSVSGIQFYQARNYYRQKGRLS